MMATYVTRNGQRMTPWMAYQIDRLDHDMYTAFGVRIVVNSAIRLPNEQLDIWYSRYVTAGNVRGRKVYDTRWWNGQLWYRISSAGTVAQPGTSNHEVQGNRAAVDIADTGRDSGIMNKNSTRGRWLRANAWRYDMVASGDGFNEGWHFDINNIHNTPPAPPAPAPALPKELQEDGMIIINVKVGPYTHICALDKGHFAHLVQSDIPAVAQDITGQDKAYEFDISHLPKLLRYYGCQLNIWDFRDPNTGKSVSGLDPKAAFMVLDPLDGSVKSGNAWTAEKWLAAQVRDAKAEILAALSKKP